MGRYIQYRCYRNEPVTADKIIKTISTNWNKKTQRLKKYVKKGLK